ncbi:hypothetical protein A3Q56_05491, partial [Intoshia linei]
MLRICILIALLAVSIQSIYECDFSKNLCKSNSDSWYLSKGIIIDGESLYAYTDATNSILSFPIENLSVSFCITFEYFLNNNNNKLIFGSKNSINGKFNDWASQPLLNPNKWTTEQIYLDIKPFINNNIGFVGFVYDVNEFIAIKYMEMFAGTCEERNQQYKHKRSIEDELESSNVDEILAFHTPLEIPNIVLEKIIPDQVYEYRHNQHKDHVNEHENDQHGIRHYGEDKYVNFHDQIGTHHHENRYNNDNHDHYRHHHGHDNYGDHGHVDMH